MMLSLRGRHFFPLLGIPVLGAGVLFCAAPQAEGTTQHFEKHFPVKGRPVVCIHNIANGRIEVKSTKGPEVVVAGTQASTKVSLETESAGDRIDVSASAVDPNATQAD